MSQNIRTFIAVEIDPAVTGRAIEVIDRLREAPVDVKWVEPENMHLTVKFLGDVDISDSYEICKAAARAVRDMEPFDLDVRGVGAFPNLQRPRTIWLGGGEGEEQMAELANRLDDELFKVGFRKEGRRFQTHLTLGRVHSERGPAMAELSGLLQQYADLEIGLAPIDEVVVFSSTLTRTGPIYDPLGRARLGG
jgi:2'-5' RNA ligase